MNEVAKYEKQSLPSMVFTDADAFRQIFDIGKMFSSSTLVPQHYQGKPMDCTIAIDMADRMGVSPMFVMQNLYIVQGKPQWSGQACTALIKAGGLFDNIRHVYTGGRSDDTRGCYLTATRAGTGETVDGPEVTIAMAKAEGWYNKNGSKWKTMPELMLAYRASAFFARIHVPESLMGVMVDGEAEDTGKARRTPPGDPLAKQDDILVDSKVIEEAEGLFK